jgi:hypothetical protein
MASLVIGPPARGDDFFDREVEQKQMWRRLHTSHVLLLAARRVGKTSLMYKLRDTATAYDFLAVLVSMAPAQTEMDFVRRLYAAIVEVDGTFVQRAAESQIGRLLSRLLPRSVEAAGVSVELQDTGHDAWGDLGRAITSTLSASPRRWLLMVDEVPIFVLKLLKGEGGRQRAVTFLDWLRDLRQQTTNVRWVLAGSVGLDALAERHSFTASLNDLEIVHLGAFRAEAADRYVQELGQPYGLTLTGEVRARLLQRVGWPIPFFLNLMVSMLLDPNDEGVDPDVAAVDLAFDRLVSYEKRAYFDHWRQRLYEQLEPGEARQAHGLLDTISADPQGASHDTLRAAWSALGGAEDERDLHLLLGLLHTDGYIIEDEGRYKHRSPLLRAFWAQHARGKQG